jgi:hypothetical protein
VIVFPVLPDLESRIGDKSERTEGNGGGPASPLLSGQNVADSGLGSSGWSSSTLSAADLVVTGQEGVPPTAAAKLSYSVSYFSWSVSEDSEEEEEEDGRGGGVDGLTARLERVKIRRSSRERNELRSGAAAAAAQVILPLPRP